MSTATQTLTMSPADLLKYRDELVRTGKFLPLGRLRTIAIAPNANYTPPPNDPIIKIRGRMMDLSDQYLPIAQAPDKQLVLVTSTLWNPKKNEVGLPDLADPTWRAPNWTEDEVTGKVDRPAEKDRVGLVPQRLEDRTNEQMEGTNFLVFQPVLRVTYQPEKLNKDDHGFQPTEWKIDFRPDGSGYSCAFLCDPRTGQCHFFGGIAVFGGDTRG
jgi:hypothetical protein